MRVKTYFNLAAAVLGAALVIVPGFLAVPAVFADRVLPGVLLGSVNLTGISAQQLPGTLSAYNAEFKQQTITVALKGINKQFTLEELGVEIDRPATVNLASDTGWLEVFTQERVLQPQVSIDSLRLNAAVNNAFTGNITPPKNAGLLQVAGVLQLDPSKAGEAVNLETFKKAIAKRAQRQNWQDPITLEIITVQPSVLDTEVESARQHAQTLLGDGFSLAYKENSWEILPYTIRRLIIFKPVADPSSPGNEILGVSLDRAGLVEYLNTTIAPEVAQAAQDAKFERQDNKVVQFEVPREGRQLDAEKTADIIIDAIAARGNAAEPAVAVTSPNIKDLSDIEALGISDLLATGESDYVGSPPNRVHNIKTGTSRYHGLLIEPGQEFSFNGYLGPVDAAHGYKPELVIKSNQTIPEYGGGLCQVSTTIFRAAAHAGLEMTQRRNHAYAVRYYGTPGFDATIYPPYTDLRFINNTPGYILIQARFDGTKLQFELWGTDDGREVEVTGPVTYDHQPDGSVKATVKQHVTRNGEVLLDETFYSRYRSPNLYPKVQGAKTVEPTGIPATPTNEPTPSSTPDTSKTPGAEASKPTAKPQTSAGQPAPSPSKAR